MNQSRFVVIGGGIVGLAVADRILASRPGAHVVLLEKEAGWAVHQTGRNSGVVHSGLYYKPGSYKAQMCRRGSQSIVRFAEQEGVAFDRCGKLVVATRAAQLPQLAALAARGRRNGLQVTELDPAAAREYEPQVSCVAALRVPETAIIDYRGICAALVRRLEAAGADLRLSTRVTGLRSHASGTTVETINGEFAADTVVNCAGLYSDRVAGFETPTRARSWRGRSPSERADVQIVPFRGEYFELRENRRDLVNGLIYPVPDPTFPFLGVHLTRMIDGGVHAGPNAVLALAREGYGWTTIRPAELGGTLAYPGFWRLARQHAKAGAQEMRRSFSRHRFADSLRELVPAIADDDLVRAPAGVRAQAILRDGSLVDDFLIRKTDHVVHVLNAPSPAATSALEIAAHIESLLPT